MKRIPIDVSAPIACTATQGDIATRIDQISVVRDRLRSIERTEAGLLLQFDPSPGLEAHLDQFADDEKNCCQFWGFTVATTEASLTLAWDGPPDAQDVLDELHRYFTSDEPLTPFSGLL
jgi:hypothetical protein